VIAQGTSLKEVVATKEHKNLLGYGNDCIAPIGAQAI
jgi:hypothetical protein